MALPRRGRTVAAAAPGSRARDRGSTRTQEPVSGAARSKCQQRCQQRFQGSGQPMYSLGKSVRCLEDTRAAQNLIVLGGALALHLHDHALTLFVLRAAAVESCAQRALGSAVVTASCFVQWTFSCLHRGNSATDQSHLSRVQPCPPLGRTEVSSNYGGSKGSGAWARAS